VEYEQQVTINILGYTCCQNLNKRHIFVIWISSTVSLETRNPLCYKRCQVFWKTNQSLIFLMSFRQ